MNSMLKIAQDFQDKNLLRYNADKSQYMCTKFNRTKQDEIKVNLNNLPMKQTAKYKYLGNIVNEKCNLDDTINDKCNSGNKIIYEMVTLLKNPVLNANRIEVGIKIIETILIPKILYGCETWTNITKQQIDKLEKIQKDALQRIFNIPRTTSRFGLYFECGILPIEHRIIIRKLMYLKKILNMPDSRLVKIVYNEQKRLGMTKCWWNEVWTIIKNLGITINENHISIMTKKEWSKLVKAIIVVRLNEINKKNSETKLRLIRNSHFGLKAYLKDTKASDLLMLKLNMIDLKANYTAKYKDNTCRRCGKHKEYVEHLWECKKFKMKNCSKDKLLSNDPKALKRIMREVKRFCK